MRFGFNKAMAPGGLPRGVALAAATLLPWYPQTPAPVALYEFLGGAAVDGSGNLKQLLDSSGNGNHGPVQMAALRPAWSAAGVIGGRPSATFDGFTTYLQTGTVNLASPCTILMVLSLNSVDGIGLDGPDASNRELLYIPNVVDYYYGASLGPAQSVTVPPPTGARVEMIRTGALVSVQVGATLGTATEIVSADIATSLTVGASHGGVAVLDGAVSLIVCFPVALTAPQLAAWRTAIFTRFGV